MIHEFKQRGEEKRVAVDMSRVEAVLEEESCTCIVTGTDTYYVTQDFNTVLCPIAVTPSLF